MITRLGLFRRIELPVAMPFSNVSRIVSRGLQQARQGNLFFSQMHRVSRRNPIVNAQSIGGAPGQKSRSGWGTNRRRGIAIGEASPLGCEAIQMWRSDRHVAETTKVTVAQIVTQDDHEIGFFLSLTGRGSPQNEAGHQRACEIRPVVEELET